MTSPITAWREELLGAIRDHQVVIVAGETGSGKSTQLPKLCLELGRGIEGRIGHTQPRRIAARSIAERIAEELGTPVGGLVGYTVLFTDHVDEATAVKVMTDGILLNEPPARSGSPPVRHDHHRRGARAVTERRLPARILQAAASQTPGPPGDRHLGDESTRSGSPEHLRRAAPSSRSPVGPIPSRSGIGPSTMGPGDARDQTTAICDAVTELTHEGPGDIPGLLLRRARDPGRGRRPR